MPRRLQDLANRIVSEGPISAENVRQLVEVVNEDQHLSIRERRVLNSLLRQPEDTFEPGAREALTRFIENPVARVDLPDPEVMDKHQGSITWGQVEGGQLYVDGVSFDDVIQGSIANCYMPGAFSALAHANPDYIKNAIQDNGDGTFTVRFFEAASWGQPLEPVHVTVDDDIPLSSPGGQSRYGRARESTELWVSVLEKAYAEWKGGYEAIGNGGRATEVMEAITGRRSSWQEIGRQDPDALFDTIRSGTARNQPMTAGTHGKDSDVNYNGTGISAWHVYTVLGATEEDGQKLIELRNPWGHTEWGSDGVNDGIFKMPLEEFTKLFNNLHLN
jgi:hypothetical protein